MISKELLSEVLKLKECQYVRFVPENNHVEFHDMNSDMSICELVQLCKEWLYSKEYFIRINHRLDNSVHVEIGKDETSFFGVEHFHSNTETKAVFKACEYILKQKDNK